MLFGRKTASEAAQEGHPAGAEALQPAGVAQAATGGGAPVQHKRLGQVLLEEGLITTGQLEKALAEQERTGDFLGKILVQQGSVTQSALSSCLVKQCKIPHLNLLDYEVSQDVLALIPVEVCRRFHLLPIDKLGRILTVAMVDPLDTEALEEIRRHCGELKIKPILCNWEHYEAVAAKAFGTRVTSGGGTHAVTAESLGLRAMSAVPKADPAPTPLPLTRPVPAPGPSLSDSQLSATAPSGVSASELTAAMRESVRDAVREAVVTLGARSEPTARPLSSEDIANAIRGAVADAMSTMAARQPQAATGPNMEELGALMRQSVQEAVAATAREMRPAPVITPAELLPAAAPAPDYRELGEVLRNSVQEAVSAIAKELRPAAAPVAAQTPQITPEQMGAAIQEGVGHAMHEAMGLMVTQLKALAPRQDDTRAEVLAGAVRDSVREAIEASAHAQHEQGSRLAEIAEATLQSVQQTTHLIESTAVQKHAEKDLLRAPQGRHASVSSFRGSPSGTMDQDVKVVDALESSRPAEAMTFETYVPGAVNAFTFKVCQQVALHPGAEYNPLFLFGHVGSGKTHLISATGNQILKGSPLARVGYVSASHFARRLKEAMNDDALDAFREHYAHWDVLILDDIQFLAGRVEAQEEFFHIFNALHQQGRQIIIASDKAPDRLGLLEQRLISRFASGIVAELRAPEWEARMTILRQLAKQAGAVVPEAVLALIAMRVADDVRKLTGCLRKVIAYGQLGGQELTVELAEQIISHLTVEAAA